MNDDEIRAKHEALLDRMCRAGWLSSYSYKDGQGFLLKWTPDGDWQAEHIKGLSGLYDIHEQPFDNLITIPEGIAESLIWKRTVSKVEAFGPPLSKYEEQFLFHVLMRWHVA